MEVDLSRLHMEENLEERTRRSIQMVTDNIYIGSPGNFAFKGELFTWELIFGRFRYKVSMEAFDRLVEGRFIERNNYKPSTTNVDIELSKNGMLRIIERPQAPSFFLGSRVTTVAAIDRAEVTDLGNWLIDNIGVKALARSFIRQKLYPLLRQLLLQFEKEHLPEFLSHDDSTVRAIAKEILERP